MRTHADHTPEVKQEKVLLFYLQERRATPGPEPWTEQEEAETQIHRCSNAEQHFTNVLMFVSCDIQQVSLTDRKLNRSTLSMPRALSCRMTGARFERCISGTVDSGNFSKSSSDREREAQKKCFTKKVYSTVHYNIL